MKDMKVYKYNPFLVLVRISKSVISFECRESGAPSRKQKHTCATEGNAVGAWGKARALSPLGRTAARAAWPVTSEDFLGIADDGGGGGGGGGGRGGGDERHANDTSLRASAHGYIVLHVVNVTNHSLIWGNLTSMHLGK